MVEAHARRNSWLAPVLAATVALVVFSVTLGGTFVYDDFDVFALDARLRDLSKWPRYWTESYNGGIDNLYRPLVSLTYAVQWWIHGDARAWPFHLVNWLLHAGVSALVAAFASRLARAAGPENLETPREISEHGQSSADRIGLAAGLLFAVHPIHVEVVANVVGRAELMCAAFSIGALTLFLNRPITVRRATSIAACCTAAILCKEQGFFVAPLLLVLWFVQRTRARDASERRALVLLVVMLLWLLAAYVVFREQILPFAWDRARLDPTINPLVRSEGADRLLLPIAILGRYAALLVLPLKLSPDYGGAVIGSTARWDDPYLYIGMATAVLWLALFTISSLRRKVALSFALVGLALTYGIVSNLGLLIGTNFGERLMYLPSVFFVVIVAIGITRLPLRWACALTLVLIVIGAGRTVTYASRWNDRLSFYQWAARDQPDSVRLRMLLAAELAARGRLAESSDVVKAARERWDWYSELWLLSAEVAERQGDWGEAEASLRKALELDKRSQKAPARLTLFFERRAATRATSRPG